MQAYINHILKKYRAAHERELLYTYIQIDPNTQQFCNNMYMYICTNISACTYHACKTV